MFQVHYTPTGKVRTDRSKVGLVFSKTKPSREAFTLGVANPDLLIPAQSDNVAVASSLELASEARLLSFMPHMHLRGKDFKYTITKPGEAPQVMLSVPAYDFGWQTYYVLAEPMDLPRELASTALPTSITRTATPITRTRARWCAGASRPSRK